MKVPKAFRGNCHCGRWLLVLVQVQHKNAIECMCGRKFWWDNGSFEVFEPQIVGPTLEELHKVRLAAHIMISLLRAMSRGEGYANVEVGTDTAIGRLDGKIHCEWLKSGTFISQEWLEPKQLENLIVQVAEMDYGLVARDFFDYMKEAR